MSNSKEIAIKGLIGVPLVKKGDNVSQIILDALINNNLTLENGDILAIAQTIISKSKGFVRNLKEIKPSKEAIDIYNKIKEKTQRLGLPTKEPELIQAILDESKDILKVEHVLITETKHGFICANAGIDKSNVEGTENITTLPTDPDNEAREIRNNLKRLTNKIVAVIITDSFGRPFRVGAIGIAIGIAGIAPILDKRGEKDLFGYEMQTTLVGHIDNLAAAAQLIMGETNEGIPIVLIRGYDFDISNNASISPIIRERNMDLFVEREFFREFDKVLVNRRSYKQRFDNKDIDIKIIEECIDIARWAPNAHNNQQWRYAVIKTGKKREQLINAMNVKLRNDLMQDGIATNIIEKKIKRTRGNFINSPVLVLLLMDSETLEKQLEDKYAHYEYILGVQSISSSATYFLLALHARGLATCWYCAPMFAKEIVNKELRIPDNYIPMAFITVGYPSKPQKIPIRKNLDHFIYKFEK